MEQDPRALLEWEDNWAHSAITLIDQLGPQGITALARALDKIREHLDLCPGSLLLAPLWANQHTEKRHAS